MLMTHFRSHYQVSPSIKSMKLFEHFLERSAKEIGSAFRVKEEIENSYTIFIHLLLRASYFS